MRIRIRNPVVKTELDVHQKLFAGNVYLSVHRVSSAYREISSNQGNNLPRDFFYFGPLIYSAIIFARYRLSFPTSGLSWLIRFFSHIKAVFSCQKLGRSSDFGFKELITGLSVYFVSAIALVQISLDSQVFADSNPVGSGTFWPRSLYNLGTIFFKMVQFVFDYIHIFFQML